MTWDRRPYFPSEGTRAEDFCALKNLTASAGFEPANLVTKGQHATPRPPKPLLCISWLSLCLSQAVPEKQVQLFVQSTSPSFPLYYPKNPTERNPFSNRVLTLLTLYAVLVQFSGNWSSEMQFSLTYLQTWSSTQPHFALWHLNFIFMSLF
jgi:hypothetical protein